MTRKLYYEDAFLFEFEAQVTGVCAYKNKWAVVLDQTAFFPEGGGQPGDEGKIGEIPITDTQEADGQIYHITAERPALQPWERVQCRLNDLLRFARMQAHSGEHVISGLANSMFDANNVGFHMDGTLMTVDFDKPLDKEQIYILEQAANHCVYENLPIKAWYPTEEQLHSMHYRSKSDDLKNIRIVSILGCDNCACCAVHVDSTGKIGIIKILTCVSHRGGVRLTLLSGISAYNDYTKKHEQTLRIADMLAAKHYETDAAVEKLIERNKELQQELRKNTKRQIEYIKETSAFTHGNSVFMIPAFSAEELKTAALILKERCSGICVVISGDDCKGYSFAASSNCVKVLNFSKTITAALNGRGGGNADVIQGRFAASADEIKAYFSELTVE